MWPDSCLYFLWCKSQTSLSSSLPAQSNTCCCFTGCLEVWHEMFHKSEGWDAQRSLILTLNDIGKLNCTSAEWWRLAGFRWWAAVWIFLERGFRTRDDGHPAVERSFPCCEEWRNRGTRIMLFFVYMLHVDLCEYSENESCHIMPV